MSELNDNKLENLFFEIILNNTHLNSEILKIFDLINNQKISIEDKKAINKKVFWFLLVNEDKEIKDLLKIIRNDNIKEYLLYKLIFELIEDAFNVKDINHLNLLISNIKEEVETDLVYYIKHILDYIYEVLEKYLKSKDSLFDNIKDYLNDNELEEVLLEIDKLFWDIIIEFKDSKKKREIEEKIKNVINKKSKILGIK